MESAIKEIYDEAKKCHKCYPGSSIHVPTPDPNNSGIEAEIFFLFERPGRIGTTKSNLVSFDNEDPTAKSAKKLLEIAGIDRRDIFIANAVFCHPCDDAYRDKPPNMGNIKNCSTYLRKLIDTVQPKLLITIGTSALKAAKYLYPHCTELKNFKLKNNIGTVITENKPTIYPLYHTSRLAQNTRKENEQIDDWKQIPKILSNI